MGGLAGAAQVQTSQRHAYGAVRSQKRSVESRHVVGAVPDGVVHPRVAGLQAEWLKPAELAQTPQRHRDREAADRDDPRPQWALDAGFPNVYEARNDGCHERTAHLFRDGKRIEVAA